MLMQCGHIPFLEHYVLWSHQHHIIPGYLFKIWYVTGWVHQHKLLDFFNAFFSTISCSTSLQNIRPNLICNPHLLFEGHHGLKLMVYVLTDYSCCCLFLGMTQCRIHWRGLLPVETDVNPPTGEHSYHQMELLNLPC